MRMRASLELVLAITMLMSFSRHIVRVLARTCGKPSTTRRSSFLKGRRDQLECTDPARNNFLELAGDSTDLVHCKGRPRD